MKSFVKTTKMLCVDALGIAMYVALSMMAKIPVIGNISLDLGYIVLAVFCYIFGKRTGIIVGAFGCAAVSLLTSGLFPPGWIAANVMIGCLLGGLYQLEKEYVPHRTIGSAIISIGTTILVVFMGVCVLKSCIECVLFNIPLAVKLPKNCVAAFMDMVCMIIGYLFAPLILERAKHE